MTKNHIPSIGESGGGTTRLEIVGDIIYRGLAIPGSLDSAPVWLITRLDATDNGEYPTLFPDGKASYTNIWDDRVSLTYS